MITASIILCAGGARAESKDADRLFLEGRELHKAGKYKQACAKFERAHELDNGPGIVANLADCRERFGDPAEAWRLYRDAAARWDNADGAKLARKRAEKLEERLAVVVLGVPEPELDGLTITINGRAVAPASEIRDAVEPGEIEIAAKAPGRPRFRRTRTAAAGETVVVELAFETAQERPAPPLPPPGGRGERGRGRRRLAIGLGVLGVAGVATGVGLGFYADSRYERVARDIDLCTNGDPPRCNEEGTRRISDAQRIATFGTGAVIGGGALAALGVILYATAPRGVTAAPVVGSGAVGVRIARSF
jgi:tetratricopeptide (TPR) repeat protein